MMLPFLPLDLKPTPTGASCIDSVGTGETVQSFNARRLSLLWQHGGRLRLLANIAHGLDQPRIEVPTATGFIPLAGDLVQSLVAI